jgi:lipopolysaccharide export system protein LptA
MSQDVYKIMRTTNRLSSRSAPRCVPLLPLAALALLTSTTIAHSAPGEQAGCPNVDPTLPISVAADASEFQKNESRVVLNGSVTIQQGVLNLYADEVVISYMSGDTRDLGSQGTVRSLVATGTVKVECEGDRAHGRKAFYNIAQHNIELTGDVLLVRGNNVLKGEKLYIDLDTGNTAIEGGQAAGAKPTDTRIKAVFTPPPRGEVSDKAAAPEGENKAQKGTP